MTGEVTLHENEKSVGEINVKVMGAYEAGMKKVIIPKENKDEMERIPLRIRYEMKVILVDHK